MGIISIDLGPNVLEGPVISFIDSSQTSVAGDTENDVIGDHDLLFFVPEPSAGVLLGLSVVGLGLLRWSHRPGGSDRRESVGPSHS